MREVIENEIVEIAAPPGQEPHIFAPLRRAADP
jgi:hypothetical protein